MLVNICYFILWNLDRGPVRETGPENNEKGETINMQYMDMSLLLYIGMLALGVLIGSRKQIRSRELPWLGRLQFVALIVLIAVLGVEIGSDDKVISSLGEIGLSALVITVFALAGSVLAVSLVRRLLKLDRQGRTETQRKASERGGDKI